MPTALRDMQPWRRAILEHGWTFQYVADRTGKSLASVRAYSIGARRAPADWIAAVERLAADHEKGNAA
jgi:hypothetical protein